MAVITTAQVQRRITGLKPYLALVDADELDEVLEEGIEAATARFERELEACLERTVIKQDPDEGDELGEDYDRTEPALDWHRRRMDKLITINLRRRPVLSVERIRLKLNDEIHLITFPAEWYEDHIQHNLGRVTLVPAALGHLATVGAGVPVYHWLTTKMPWGVIPQCFYVNYTAGFDNADTDPELGDLRRHLSVQAALYAMEDIRDMLPSSVSVDGASETFDTVQQRLEARAEAIEGFFAEWRSKRLPARMVVI